jgi:DNA-binding transcriptional MocR family regulator
VPNAGAIAFVKFKGALTSLELGRLLAEKGISIKPAYCFSGNDDDESDDVDSIVHCFRVGFGERKMPLALEAFVEVIEEFKDEWREEMKKKYSKNYYDERDLPVRRHKE